MKIIKYSAFQIMLLFFIISCEDKQNNNDDMLPNTEITLETCTENINDNVPSFFKKYFKCVDVELSNDQIIISSDGIPPHKSWYFSDGHPNSIDFESQGDGYYENPNSIKTQNLIFTIPVSPSPKGIQIDISGVDGVMDTDPQEFSMGPVGIALDGVSLFNPLAAPGDDIENEKYSFDFYSGHPQMSGTYHYHTNTRGPLEVLKHHGLIETTTPGSGEIEVYGIMCDGTVILGCTELDGSPPNSSGLDAQNGHIHDLVDEDSITHFINRYHTHICPGQLTNHKFTPELQYYDGCY